MLCAGALGVVSLCGPVGPTGVAGLAPETVRSYALEVIEYMIIYFLYS